MKQWLIPAIVVLAVNLAGFGVGWFVNEWQDGDQPPVRSEQPAAPVQTGRTQAELDAQRCEAALQALGNVDRRSQAYPEIKDAIDRYCH